MNLRKLFKQKSVFVLTAAVFLLFLAGFFGDITAQMKRENLKLDQGRELKKLLTLEKAQEVMVQKVYKNQIGNRAMFAHPQLKKAGIKISSWRQPNLMTIKKDAWFFFVDEQPGANWEHKASYVAVDQENGEVERIETMSPPVEALDLKPMNNQAVEQMQVLRLNVQSFRKMEVVGKVDRGVFAIKKQRYAVLLNGGMNADYNYGRYWNDLQFIYKALKQKYNYTDAEIIVLYANGTHSPNEDLDGDGTDDVDYSCTKANLTTVMKNIETSIAADGKFFFYATNHGGDDAGDHNSNLILWGESIKDSDFAALTKNIKCGQAVYVMEQCFSGGMMDDILKAQTYPCSQPKVCVMTAARHDEVSWGCDTEGSYNEYVYYWTSAIFGKTPTGAAVNADTNGNGVVSMKEAHEYAVSHDSRDEHPQIGSCINGASDVTL